MAPSSPKPRRPSPRSPAVSGNGDLPQRFKRVYHHLYSNSSASRAEALLAELSLLLLVKLLGETKPEQVDVAAFVRGRERANDRLLPPLRAAYPELVDASDRFRLEDGALRHALAELEPVRLSESAAHVLGEAFQALMGPRIRGDRGQFFTPRSLVRAMVSVLAPKAGETILDPACGTGGFLYEALAFVEARGGTPAAVHGADKDRDLARFAAALLAYRGRLSHVANLNSLARDAWKQSRLRAEYDVILTNPPFGTKIPIRDPSILADYALAHEWALADGESRFAQQEQLVAGQDPQVLFLELCIAKLRDGGRMGIVLPEGLFGNRREAHLWDFVRERGEITALLDCPRTTFQPGTDTKTNVLFFRKGKGKQRVSRPVPVAVALSAGHDRRGRSERADGSPFPDDFAAIGAGLRLGARAKRTGTAWRPVRLTQPYYLVPRYYVDEPPTSAAEASILRGAPWLSLGELVQRGLLDIRKGHEVGSEAYGGGEVPFVRTSDLANFEVSSDPTKSVSEEVYARFAPEQRLHAGSILMVADGRYRIGTTALLTERSSRCVVQSHLRIIDTLRPAELEPFALLFALSLLSVRRRIRDLVFIQSTLGTLGSRLLELRIPLLAGPGPWRRTVDDFRRTLTLRDELLGTLGQMIGPELEL